MAYLHLYNLSDKNAPIGFLDSGLGGLSVWKEVKKRLPSEATVYYADQANCPYGSKTAARVEELVFQAVEVLMSYSCKLIVVACNTATAAAVDSLRDAFGIPFIGMEPAIKPASLATQTGHIGVLATAGTLSGKLYQQTKEKFAQNHHVHIQAGEGLVELVEEGRVESKEAEALLRTYIQPMLDQGIDQLVLGCTHYPFLLPTIHKIIPHTVKVHDPAPAIAKRVKEVLGKNAFVGKAVRKDVFVSSKEASEAVEKFARNLES